MTVSPMKSRYRFSLRKMLVATVLGNPGISLEMCDDLRGLR